MAGLPGTGKSTLARALASSLGGVVLDKDQVRAALFPDAWLEYSQEQDDFCVDLLLQTGGYLVARSAAPAYIFIDGRTFSRRYQIERVVSYAVELSCPFKIIHLTCSDESARQRLTQNHVAKNRDFNLYLKVKAAFEPIEREHLTVNTDGGLTGALIEQSLQYLKGR